MPSTGEPSTSQPSPGQRVGEYLLIDRIGGGAFGEVWRARHHAWATQVVAVKIPTGPSVRQLQLEGAALRRLDHPNVVKPLGIDPYADPPYLVMEYVAGESLRDRIRRGPIPPREAAAILLQVLSALDHAHTRGLIHRDVKPENVLIDLSAGDGPTVVKVADFGLGKAAALSQPAHHSIILSREAGADGSVVGSTGYMAPEQQDGGEVDARADLYACGVLLFEMLTGRRPEGVELPSDLNPTISSAFDEVFRRSFARRERRFASAAEFSRALAAAARLDNAAGAAPATASVPPPLPAASPRSRRAHWGLVGVVAAGIAAGYACVIVGLAPRSHVASPRTTATAQQPPADKTPAPGADDQPGALPTRGREPAPPPAPAPEEIAPPPPPAVVPPEPPPQPSIRVVNQTGAAEAEDVVRALQEHYADALQGVKTLELVKCHDATEMRRHAGGPQRVDGSYSREAVVGRNDFIMLWGIYERLPAGQYLVAYRLQSPDVLDGNQVCFLDVCHDGHTIAGLRPPADQVGQGRWSVIPVPLRLAAPTNLEYRLWPHDHLIALDRIYVFQVR